MDKYEIVECLQLDDMRVFLVEMTYRSSHMHKEFEICLLVAGQVTVYTNHASHVFNKGDLFVFNPYQVHEFHSLTENSVILSLQFATGFFKKQCPFISLIRFDNLQLTGNRDTMSGLRKLLLELAFFYHKRDKNHEFFCTARLFELFGAIMTTQQYRIISEKERDTDYYKSMRLSKIVNYIEDHYQEKLLLSDFAEKEHLSLHYLSHLFKGLLGMPFQKYVALKRFELARRLVEHTQKSIAEICLECGFSDYRYLNRIYVQQLGYTPLEYRSSHSPPHPIPKKRSNSTRRIRSATCRGMTALRL